MISSHPYAQPVLNRPKDLELVKKTGPAHGVANGAGIGIRGLEIAQTIQSIDNQVRLIAGKATVARLYLDPTAIASNALVTGELGWRRDGGGMAYLPAINRVKLTPVTRPSLQEQRFNAALSLNFVLPLEAVEAGPLELTVQRIYVPGANDVPIAAPVQLSVEFRKAPILRVRAIGLRYKSLSRPGSFATPDATHFNFLRSYLLRAYPVAALDWSQLVVDADLLIPPFGGNASDLANAQLTALRAREMSSGVDPRTHYYGLVDDDRGTRGCFMRGSAVYDETARTFGLIASGPTGVPRGDLKWDSDASYADWYGAHELGHTFQRRHPGFPRETQPCDPDEPGFPYPDGLITSVPDNRFVGFDVGDPALAIPMRALPGNVHHDVMTYANNQWLSAYTYEAIHERLMDEEIRLAREGV